MTGYATAEVDRKAREPAPPPPVFTDILEAAPGVKPAAVRWVAGDRPGTGLLEIATPANRCRCLYTVRECPVGWDGRAARFSKAAGDAGSDREESAYDVFVGRNGQDRRCDCKGFTAHGHCKHTAALACLIGNGWLDLHLCNPDADAGPTEPPDDQPERGLPEIPDPPADDDQYLSPGDAAACDEFLYGPREELPPIDWTDIPL